MRIENYDNVCNIIKQIKDCSTLNEKVKTNAIKSLKEAMKSWPRGKWYSSIHQPYHRTVGMIDLDAKDLNMLFAWESTRDPWGLISGELHKKENDKMNKNAH